MCFSPVLFGIFWGLLSGFCQESKVTPSSENWPLPPAVWFQPVEDMVGSTDSEARLTWSKSWLHLLQFNNPMCPLPYLQSKCLCHRFVERMKDDCYKVLSTVLAIWKTCNRKLVLSASLVGITDDMASSSWRLADLSHLPVLHFPLALGMTSHGPIPLARNCDGFPLDSSIVLPEV